MPPSFLPLADQTVNTPAPESTVTPAKAARAFQILATLVVSAVLPLVLYAAISTAPETGKLGLYIGLMLAVFSVFELIAFSFAAVYASKGETDTSLKST